MSDSKVTLQEYIREEYKKCLVDPVYFMRKYVKIQHPIRGTIPFALYPFQASTLQDFATHDFNIVLKSRQMGISTLVAAYSLWLMVFHKDKNVMIISIKQEVSKEIVSKVRFANDNLPTWLKVECKEDNRLSLKLANGSQIVALSSATNAGRSAALSLLVLDEAAFIEKAEEIWAAAQPTLSTGGKAILLSCVTKDTYVFTPDGISQVEDFIDVSKTGGYERDQYGVMGVGKIRFSNLFHNNGYKDTLKLKTKFSELECTRNHKLWAYKEKTGKTEWCESEKLEVGDFIAIQIGGNQWGKYDNLYLFAPSESKKIHSPFYPNKITPELAYLFGLYISEGSCYKVKNRKGDFVGGSINITCGDDISWVFDVLKLNYNCWNGLHYTISNKNLIELFEFVGMNLSAKAADKIIPKNLLRMTRENIQWMLRGIFDGDGCGTKKIVQLTSTSKHLINQIRFLLMNFGILSGITIHTKEKMNSYKGKIPHRCDSYVLEMCGKNALKFYNNVGFALERKQKNLKQLVLSNFERACSHDVVPNTLDLVRKLVDNSQMNSKELQKKHGIFVNGYINKKTKYKTFHISRQNVLLLYSLFGHLLEPKEQLYWDKILNENIVWCPITQITNSQNETFDFSLPQDDSDFWCHSVLYNGIIGHQTPNGVGNFFHKMWVQAEEGTNKFHPIKLPWNLHPERDVQWRLEQDRVSENLKKTAQELDCDFLSSGTNVIDLILIKWFKDSFMRDPVERREIDQAYWIWEYPSYNKQDTYIVCADVARGDGEDYSAFHVLNAKTLVQCAEYKGRISTKEFGNMLVSVATYYNNALLIVEREGPGWATLQQIIDRGYPNTFYGSADLRYVDVEQQMTNKYNAEEKKLVPGFATTLRTRPAIINGLIQYFVDKSITIYSKRTYSELEVFIWDNHKPQAARGYNDDLVMSLAIGVWVRDTALRLQQERANMTKATLNQIVVRKNDQSPLYKISQERARNSWSMPSGPKTPQGGRTEDLKWLL